MTTSSRTIQTNPADRRDIAIASLSVTAVILFVTLLITDHGLQTAFADGMTVSGGDYVMSVGGAILADEEFVYVVDVPMERVIAYRFDAPRQRIEVVQGLELAELRREADDSGQSGGQAQPSSPRRRP